MTTPLPQAILDSFFTAISADNAAGVLPEKVQAFMQQYTANYRTRQAAASKPTPNTGGYVPRGSKRMGQDVSNATGMAQEKLRYGIERFDEALGRG